MISYLIRQEPNGSFTVSKWNMGTYPIEIYTVRLSPRAKCTCPGGHNHGHCKHTGMIKEWIKRGMPTEEVTV